jgi:cell division septation protein DedD
VDARLLVPSTGVDAATALAQLAATRAASQDDLRATDDTRTPGEVVDASLPAESAGEPAPEASPSAEAVADPTPEPTPEPAPEPTPPPMPEPTPAPRVAAAESALPGAPAGKTGFTVQLAAYGNLEEARALIERMRRAGIDAFHQQATVEGKVWHRVRVGVWRDRPSAEAEVAKISPHAPFPPFVTRQP